MDPWDVAEVRRDEGDDFPGVLVGYRVQLGNARLAFPAGSRLADWVRRMESAVGSLGQFDRGWPAEGSERAKVVMATLAGVLGEMKAASEGKS